MKKIHTIIRSAGLALAGCLLASVAAQAQHYPAGVEGIKGASLPPPGVYLRDYNYFYGSGSVADAPSAINDNFRVFAYVQAPRLIWMTPWKPLGLNYGMDILVPFVYTDIKVPTGPGASAPSASFNRFGLGDVQVEPLLLSTSFKQIDLAAGYAVWLPTGDFNVAQPASPGKGFFTHMLTLGGTFYFDQEKTVALSLLNRYEINQRRTGQLWEDNGAKRGQRFTAGQTYTLEAGLSKSVCKTSEIGIIGYYQQQITKDSGALRLGPTGPESAGGRSRVIAAGPEVTTVIPKIGVQASVRYAYEFQAENHDLYINAGNRTQGHTGVITLTKRF